MSPPPNSDLAILFVDDEPQALKYFDRALSDGFTIVTAGSADEAEEILRQAPTPIAVLVTDQRMPGRTGASLLASVRNDHPDVIRILTTAYSDLDGAIEAVNKGEVFRYITKPWNVDDLRQEMRIALHVYRLQKDRAALIAEKLSVKQQLRGVERARVLVAIAGALYDVPRIHDALEAYVADVAPLGAGSHVAHATDIELWTGIEAEATAAANLGKSIAAQTKDSRILAQLRTRDAGKLRAKLHADLHQLLVAGVAHMLTLEVEPKVEQDANSLLLTAEGSLRHGFADKLLFGPAEALASPPATDLLMAYIIAYAAGGSLRTSVAGQFIKVTMAIPLRAPEDLSSDPQQLNRRLFRHFERWS